MNKEQNDAKPKRDNNNQNRGQRNNSGGQRGGNKQNNRNNKGGNGKGNQKGGGLALKGSDTSRGQAIRAQRRTRDMADMALDGLTIDDQPNKKRANLLPIKDQDKLRVTFLGGNDAIGEKNLVVIEYGDEAVITDCGNELGLDLPGINYAIPDTSYLEKIKHKIKAYIITHGHLDHIGGMPHVLPKYPAPIYGSIFTIGMVKKTLTNNAETVDDVENFEYVTMNMDNHEKLLIGKNFNIELVRITHSIPESSCAIVGTPLGKIINTGDFRLDPEPLDDRPSDTDRLKELGKEGVLLLMSDSTNAQSPGRTPTEHTLQDSYHDVIKGAPGRVFVASFSSNINRIQMIINSAGEAGRKVAVDGRSMLAHIELAVKLGLLRVPKDTIVAMAQIAGLPDEKILIMCTGGQGETMAALPRMSRGEHRHIKLREGDTVVVSSNPIPGNNIAYEDLGNDLIKKGVKLFRNPTWELDGSSGPLHVSGHAYRDEHREMIEMTKPKYFIPIYAGALNRKYHQEVAIEMASMPRERTFMADNGDMLEIDENRVAKLRKDAVPHGSLLVDDSGNVVPSVVVKDRLLLSDTGLVVVVLTVDRRNGNLVTSPDIITRGFIYIRDNEELMNMFRNELRRAVSQRFKRVDLDRFKAELKDHVTHFLFDQTQRSPIVIPVINTVSGGGRGGNNKQNNKPEEPKEEEKPAEPTKEEQQKRFEELRKAVRAQDKTD